MKNKTAIASWQTRILLICFFAYAFSYLCRQNLAIALPVMAEDLHISNTALGIIGTCYFWIYGAGQLVNGYLGSRLSVRKYVFVGLSFAAVCNFFFGLSSSLGLFILFWSFNGVFQSMLWSPLVKSLSLWFNPDQRRRTMFLMSVSLIVGNIVSWLASGWILKAFSWRWTFFMPAVAVFAFSFVWYAVFRDDPEKVGLALPPSSEQSVPPPAENTNYSLRDIFHIFINTRMYYMALAAVCLGIVRESLSLWGPTFLLETQHISLQSVASTLLIMPVISFLGLYFANALNKLLGLKDRRTVTVLFFLCFVFSIFLLLFYQVNMVLTALIMAVIMAFNQGINPFITGVIPFEYSRYGLVAFIAGFFNACLYLGSGISGVLTGFVVDHWGWTMAVALWAVVCIAGAVLMLVGTVFDARSRREA